VLQMETPAAGSLTRCREDDVVALELATGQLVRPFGDAVDCELAYYLIHRLRADGDPGVATFKNWICTEAKASVADVAYWHEPDQPSRPNDVSCSG
jgi:hypothetical protein